MRKMTGPPWGRSGILAICALVLVTACTGEDANAGRETSPELKVCRQAFGDVNVDAVESILTEGGAQAESGAPARLKDRMTEQARAWTAESDDLRRDSSELCTLGVTGADSRGWMTGRVMWSTLTMDSVTVGSSAKGWRKAVDGVYAQPLKQQSGLAVVAPCRLAGTATGQERQLPLEVSVAEEGLGSRNPDLTGRVASALLRYTRTLLGCQNPLTVPDSLTS
ncbi:hypothetical protein [Streptomyces sp. NPDC093111]|uniref:hypothetical protein n=1 Tax=Streptomyces sp. NPDC093111 TaxID=3154978 RepID=UPI003426EB9E